MKWKMSKPRTESFGTISSIEGKAHVTVKPGQSVATTSKKFVSPTSKVGKSRFSAS